ncbi:paramyosin-like [Emydura macquarii macquarii]|uniref:paramyosin-like n=1 Tax=Emydura macquarii macquarii TaxID=1129001 RepID=UPI00352BA96B
MDAVSVEEENARLRERVAEELVQAERWQGRYVALLGRQARLRARLQAQSLKPLEQAARALREELEEAQGALWERQEQKGRRRRHVHQREKENQRLAETLQELEGKVSKQRQLEKTHKQNLQQLCGAGGYRGRQCRAELSHGLPGRRGAGEPLLLHTSPPPLLPERHLWDVEAQYQARADRIREKQRHIPELNLTVWGLSRRIQVLHGNISGWGDRVMEAQQEAELFQREALNSPQGPRPAASCGRRELVTRRRSCCIRSQGSQSQGGDSPPGCGRPGGCSGP